MSTYRDYCNTEKEAGRKPASMKEWAAARNTADAFTTAPRPVSEMAKLAEHVKAEFGIVEPKPSPADADSDPLDQYVQPEHRSVEETPQERILRLRRELAEAEGAVPEPIAEGAPAEPVTPATTTLPDRLIFHCENRFRRETVQPGEKIIINNQVVTKRHISIEFSEGNWVPDMSDPEDRMKAEWLLQSKSFRTGEIYLVPEIVFEPRVEVRTGPRTSVQHTTRVARPAGPLSAAIPE